MEKDVAVSQSEKGRPRYASIRRKYDKKNWFTTNYVVETFIAMKDKCYEKMAELIKKQETPL